MPCNSFKFLERKGRFANCAIEDSLVFPAKVVETYLFIDTNIVIHSMENFALFGSDFTYHLQ